MIKTVATVTGTATQTVEIILRSMDITLNVIESSSDIARSKHDAVILLGGRDISPTWYGEANVYSKEPNKLRDFLEWSLIRRAMTKNIPVMGICRGAQLIAVAYGGALWQDIKKQTGKDHPIDGTHKIKVLDKLAAHIPVDKVNSLHHQGIKMVPPGLETIATSFDGIPEAIWRPGVLGVQFHPELLFPMDGRWISIFRWFANGLK